MYSTMEEVDLLKKWVNHAAVFKWLHDRSSKYLSKWNKLICIPILILNTFSGMAIYSANIFKDNNDWNEKSIVGFVAFAIMCLIMVADLATGWYGYDLVINEFVYDSFVWVVLGCFGISGIEKFAKK